MTTEQRREYIAGIVSKSKLAPSPDYPVVDHRAASMMMIQSVREIEVGGRRLLIIVGMTPWQIKDFMEGVEDLGSATLDNEDIVREIVRRLEVI
jgi:hypothetical protein